MELLHYIFRTIETRKGAHGVPPCIELLSVMNYLTISLRTAVWCSPVTRTK